MKHTEPHRSRFSSPRPWRSITLAAGLLTTTLSASAQDLGLKAPPQTKKIAIVNATVHPVSGPPIENGVVVFEEGKITNVGIALYNTEGGDWEVIDAKGKHVYPGIISAVTQLGLTEIGAVRAMRDLSETGDITPEVRPVVAVNPDSTLIPVTRSAGILTAGIVATGGMIPGKLSVIRLDGWTWEDMSVEPDAGLAVSWPSMRTYAGSGPGSRSEDDQLKDIRQNLDRLDEVFSTASAYASAKGVNPSMSVDLRWEAMRGVFANPTAPTTTGSSSAPRDGSPLAQKSVFIQAHDYDQIRAAVTWAKTRGLRAVIVGGREAPMCAELLKANNVPVIVTGTHAFPRRADGAYDEAFTLPARLEAAGVKWCMASGQETAHERNLPHQAATAVAYGLDHDAGLRSITLSAAEVLGVADRLGSVDAGKNATLIITTGDPLELTTQVEMAWIDGRRIDLSNKQTKLAEKYREKYRRSGDLKEKPSASPATR